MTDCQHAHDDCLAESGLMFVLYDCRHSFVTLMAQAGCDISTLAAILGHSNLRTVQRYIHVGQAHQEAAMQKYGAQPDFPPDI
jgi:site-specific recombinase XerD